MATITITSTMSAADKARLRRAVERRAERLGETIAVSGSTVTVCPPDEWAQTEAGYDPATNFTAPLRYAGAVAERVDREYARKVARDLMTAIGRTFGAEVEA